MSKRRLLILLGIALLGFTSQALAELELQLDDNQAAPAKATSAPPCPCLTPTCTPTPPCPCQSTTTAAAKAQSAPAAAPAGSTGSPQAAKDKAPASTKTADEEITVSDEETSPTASAPTKGAKAKTAKAKAEDEEDLSLDETSTSTASPASKVTSNPSTSSGQASPAQTGSTQTGTGKAAVATTASTPTGKDQQAKADKFEQDYEANRWGVLKKPLFRATWDGLYSYAFSPSGFSNGFGGDFRFEVQFYRNLSLGLYYDLTLFTNPGQTVAVGPLGMFGRIILSHQGPMDLYLIGGGGINSTVGSTGPVPYPTDYHAFAGLGLTQSFGDHWGLDANAVYNYYSPDVNPLSAVSVRLGLTYAIDLASFLE